MTYFLRFITVILQCFFDQINNLYRFYVGVTPQKSVAQRTMDLKGRIVVFSIVGCPHCMRAKNTLKELHLPYTDVSLESYPQCREYVKTRTGKNTVPQVFFNSIYVGGNDDLQKLVANKAEFEKVVEEVKNNIPPVDAPEVPDPSTSVNTGSLGDFVCEPDEYARLVNELKSSGLIKDHRSGLRVHKNSFSGKEFVEWVMKTKSLDRERAIEMGQQLIDRHFGHQVKNEETFQDTDTYYRLLEDDESTALNTGATSECTPRPANELGEDMRRLILKLYSAFLSADGRRVNYKGIEGSSEFEKYVSLTKELIRVQIADASREEKLAFFINVYNAQVIHANVVHGPPVNLWQRYKFFNTMRYIIGGYAYSLQDIENGVLRSNRKGVGMFTKPFGKSDPRLKVTLETHEPLIHFALVCGAKSCPPIKTYSANGIIEQLKVAAASFLEGDDGCQVNIAKREVQLSQILKWYKEDFGSNNQEVVQFVHDHLDEGEKKQRLAELLATKNFRVSHMPYDWGVNSK